MKEREIEKDEGVVEDMRTPGVEGKSADCEEVVREAYGLRGQAKINTQRFLYERFVSGNDDAAARVVDISPFSNVCCGNKKIPFNVRSHPIPNSNHFTWLRCPIRLRY